MEIAMLMLTLILLVLTGINLFLLSMMGSVLVQIVDILAKLPKEIREAKSRKNDDKPWYTDL